MKSRYTFLHCSCKCFRPSSDFYRNRYLKQPADNTKGILSSNWLPERVRWTLTEIQPSWPHPRSRFAEYLSWILMKAGAKGVMGSALRSFPSSSSSLAFRLSLGLALLPCSVLPTKPVEKVITSLLGITNIVVVKCCHWQLLLVFYIFLGSRLLLVIVVIHSITLRSRKAQDWRASSFTGCC